MCNNSKKEWPLISVIIPVRNEGRFIGRTIDYITDQDYPRDKLEIIIVDGQSNDNTREIVNEKINDDSRISLYLNPKRLSSAARNIGVKKAKGSIVTFIDGHIYIDNQTLLKNIAVLMDDKQVSVLSRPQFLDTPENSDFQKAVSAARKSLFGHGLDSTIYLKEEKYVDPTSSAASYKSEVFEKAGFFDENFDAAEDLEFNYRVGASGFTSFSSMKVAVYYYPRDDFKSLFKQMMRYGIGRFRFFKKHKKDYGSGAALLAISLVTMLILSILSLFSALAAGFWIICILTYLIASVLGSLSALRENNVKTALYLPMIYPVIHAGLALGFLKAAFSFNK
jgi:glycosyltransferase involved in cell wall biosynthesis